MAVKNKKKKKDETLAKRSWFDAYGSISEGLGELSGKVADMDNPLNRNLQIVIESGLVGMLAEHLKNRRDAKAAGKVPITKPGDDLGELLTQNPEISAYDLAKSRLPEGATGLSNIPKTSTLEQTNQGRIDTVFQGAEEANYTGNTNLAGGIPKISTPNVDLGKIASADIPGLSAKSLAASGGDLGKLVTQNPQEN